MARFFAVFVAAVLAASPAWAADMEAENVGEVVVTASRIEEPAGEAASSVEVITREEIEKTETVLIPELLRRVAGLNLVQSGGPGKSSTVLLRGGATEHVLVMIDGVKVKSTTLGIFDFGGITVADIERIEIVKGPQSTIYGSEAMAGVINIITKKGKGKTEFDLSYETGSHDTQKPAGSVSGGGDRYDYRLSAVHYDTEGISVFPGGTEKDGYRNNTISGRFGWSPSQKIKLDLTGRYYKTRNEIDQMFSDDPDYVQTEEHELLSLKTTYYTTDIWEQALTVSEYSEEQKNRNAAVAFLNSDFDGEIRAVDWQHNIYPAEGQTVVVGGEYREESGKNAGVFDITTDNKAVYVNGKTKRENVVVTAGVRVDEHEVFGSETTYRVGAVQDMSGGVKFRASYARAYRAPSINEMFYSSPTGDPSDSALKPETSKAWEVGLEEDLGEGSYVSATYFEQKYKNLIEWAPMPSGLWAPQNIARARVKGVESAFFKQISDVLGFKVSYAYLDTEDRDTGERLSRRPIDKFVLSVDYTSPRLTLLADYIYVGKRFDKAGGADLFAYNVVNLSGSYRLGETFTLFARAENVLDEDYQEAVGYATLGRTYYGGLEARF